MNRRRPIAFRQRLVLRFLTLFIATATASACGNDAGGSKESGEVDVKDGGSTTVRVFAASSLAEAFGELETSFEAQNPDIDVELNLAASSSLRAQILSGAPADVFAPASTTVMARTVEAGFMASEGEVFATNRLAIAVSAGNPQAIETADDFEKSEPLLGVCAKTVPCGELAEQVFVTAGVKADIDTREPNVRSLLAKIESGELDGGLVYASDIETSTDAEGIDLPPNLLVRNSYPIAVTNTGRNLGDADAFVAYVLSSAGQDILLNNGFGPPQ